MALEPKQLVYQGTFGKEDNPLPKVKYEDIPKERRKKLHRKRLYNVVPEEFEEWLAVELDFNKYRYISEGIDFEHTKKRLADEEDQKSLLNIIVLNTITCKNLQFGRKNILLRLLRN